MQRSLAEPTLANPPAGMPRIVPHVVYDDVSAAVDWLTKTFGFQERTWVRHTDSKGRITRTQLSIVDSVISVGEPSVHAGSPKNGVSSMLYVYVDDVDGHCRRATQNAAKIVVPLQDRDWGDRTYQASDPEGHQWVFAQHVRDVELDQEHLEER